VSARAEKELNRNVGKQEYNDEWYTVIELPQQSHSRKNWSNICLLPDLHFVVGWEHSHWGNCLQDENHENTHQLFHRKHGHL